MIEWAAEGGKFASYLLTFIGVGLAFIVGWCLRALLAPPGPPTTPTELGRSWAGWVVLMLSMSVLYKFFISFDFFSLVLWILSSSVTGILAFVFGWGYGNGFKLPNRQPTQLSNDTPGSQPVVSDDSITTCDLDPGAKLSWLSGEQLAFCEGFIGRNGLSYYLPRFKKFAQKTPKLTPAFDVFSAYKYTAKFFEPNWNWSAFLFTYGWALYRKLYAWSIVLFLASAFCFLAITEGAAELGLISLVAVHIAFGMYANAVYYSKAKEIVVAAARTARSKTQGRSEVDDKGGVNLLGGWVAAGQVLVGIPAIWIALGAHDQQGSITGYSPGQVSLSSSSDVMDTPKIVEEAPAGPVAPAQNAAKIDDPYKRMEAMYRKQRYGDLVAAVQGHLLGSPNDITALNYGGLALQALGDMNGAWQLFQKAIALSPDDAVLYYNLSSTYSSDEYKTIIEILKVAKTKDPDNKFISDSLTAWQQHAQKIDLARREQAEYRKRSSSAAHDDDKLECRVKPVMTDAEIRHWRTCSQK